MVPPAVGPDEMLACAWFGKVRDRTTAPCSFGVQERLLRNVSFLQEKVEVIRTKKPHIIEPVRMHTKPLLVAQRLSRVVFCLFELSISCETPVIRSLAVQTDAILKVTSTCICGSDLHLHLGYVPGMEPGEVPYI